MSALLVDDLIVPLPTRQTATGWRHVEHAEGVQHAEYVEHAARPRPYLVTDAAPVSVGASRQAAPLQLTARGIAVIVIFFLSLMVTAAVVLVTSFLSVSNDPLPAPAAQQGVVSTQA